MSTENNNGLGGIQLPSDSSPDNSAGGTAGDSSASAQVIRTRKERSDKGKPRKGGAPESPASLPALSAGAFAKLYSPELWGRALSAPATTMAAITGKAHWKVSDEEKSDLGAAGSIAAQVYAISDPRALAVCLALVTILDVYGMRLAKDWADSRKEKAEKKKQKEEDFHKPQ